MLKINDKSKDVAFAVLIGGKSTRFGTDKGLFEFQGKPLVSHLLNTLKKGNHDIFLIAHTPNQIQDYIDKIEIRNIVAFILDDHELLPDLKLQAPLLGLYSAFKELNKLGYKRVFALSCDTPLIQLKIITYIINQSHGFDCCIPRWNNGYIEPLLALYQIEKAYHKSKVNLLKNDLKLTNLVDKNWKINYISIEKSIKPLDEDLLTFVNINTLEDLKKFKS